MDTSTSNRGLISFIWKFIRPQKWVFLVVFLVSLAWALDVTVWPLLLRFVIDGLTQYESNREAVWPAIKVAVFCALAFWIVIDLSFRLQGYLLARAIPKLEADIRVAMFDHIQRHSPKYFNEHFAGSLANKISDMTTHATLLVTQMLWMMIPVFFSSILSVIFFSALNLVFSLILAVMIIVYALICYFFTRKCESLESAHGEIRSSLLGKIVDSLTNNYAVNLFFRFGHEKSQIERYQKEERQKHVEAKKSVEWMRACLSVTFVIGGMLINGLMLSFWMKNKLTTGEIVQIFNMTWNIITMLWITGTTLPAYYQSVGIAKQALSIMNDPQDILDVPNAQPLNVKKGEIIFENVSFKYGEKQLFQNKDVHIHGGERVGLVGFSGAGKSTFVSLILRFYPVDQGKILIDGQEIAKVTLESLRTQVALIPQDPLLFHRTLEENIRFGNVDATKEEVLQVAKLAHCDEFIKKTPKGYDTLVGERGTKLSGGERQRIAIARAMLAKAPILILDEATSALDSVTEKYIQESLEKLMQKRTTLVIAHRLSTLAKMDRILVFDHGKIVEEGSHNDLLKKEGRYAKMWRMQAGGFLPDSPISP